MPNPYRNKTEFYGIPVIGTNQRLSEQEELKKFNIIENQLLAATKGVMCCVFEEGAYSLVNNVDETYTLMLMPTGQNVAIEGVIRGGYCYSKKPIVWEGMRKGRLYHVYLQYTDKLYQDETKFEVCLKDSVQWERTLNNFLYLASVDLRENPPKVNTNPDGKVYSSDIARHASDITNPHGLELHQDAVFFKRLVMEVDGEQKILFDSKGHGILNEFLKGKIKDLGVSDIVKEFPRRDIVLKEKVLEVLSGGSKGIEIEVNGEIIESVSVAEKVITGEEPTFALGEIALKYGKNNKATIYNSGSSDVSMVVVIHYR